MIQQMPHHFWVLFAFIAIVAFLWVAAAISIRRDRLRKLNAQIEHKKAWIEQRMRKAPIHSSL